MVYVTKVIALPQSRLDVEFSDGTRGIVSLADELWGPVFEPLRDPAFFAQARLDEFGVICWPNGADLDPDALRLRVLSSSGQVSASA